MSKCEPIKHFRVVEISNNPEDNPNSVDDTLEFPDLVNEIEDETDWFVIDEETGKHYIAHDFFYEVQPLNLIVKRFVVTEWKDNKYE